MIVLSLGLWVTLVGQQKNSQMPGSLPSGQLVNLRNSVYKELFFWQLAKCLYLFKYLPCVFKNKNKTKLNKVVVWGFCFLMKVARYLASLILEFLICKMKIVMAMHRVIWGYNMINFLCENFEHRAQDPGGSVDVCSPSPHKLPGSHLLRWLPASGSILLLPAWTCSYTKWPLLEVWWFYFRPKISVSDGIFSE